MRQIDEIFLEHPFYGTRQMCRHLRNQGWEVGRRRVKSLMRKMGLMAVYQTPKTTTPNPEHKKYPYLLRNVEITHANQVWSTDITYIPLGKGFLYLTAVIDWYSRKILSWRLSNTMDVDFCMDVVRDALMRYGKPKIFNTDQGSQYTSLAFTGMLKEEGIQISMDGRGRWQDNVLMERFWRTIKYENIYLHNFQSGLEARKSIGEWMDYYNRVRPHSKIGGQTPDQLYFEKEKEEEDGSVTPLAAAG